MEEKLVSEIGFLCLRLVQIPLREGRPAQSRLSAEKVCACKRFPPDKSGGVLHQT